MKGYRQKEDPWNAIISGFLTGGSLALRGESFSYFDDVKVDEGIMGTRMGGEGVGLESCPWRSIFGPRRTLC